MLGLNSLYLSVRAYMAYVVCKTIDLGALRVKLKLMQLQVEAVYLHS
jgi:hypothetical protein